jgi:hypothetical protein
LVPLIQIFDPLKKLLIILVLVSTVAATAQRRYLEGVVRDSLSGQDMIGVHVRNLDAGNLTSTNAYGQFQLPAQSGDTLVFSSIGHKTLAWIVDEAWFEREEIEFLLPMNTVYLDEVVIGDFPEYSRFKELIMEEQPMDTTLKIFGIAPVVMKGDNRLNESYIRNPLFAVIHPIDFVYQNFSKREKEKRHYHKIVQNQYTTEKVNLKFTREWVGEMTQLEGDTLTSFIAYCNFETSYLAKTPLYIINERMMELLPLFLKKQEKG